MTTTTKIKLIEHLATCRWETQKALFLWKSARNQLLSKGKPISLGDRIHRETKTQCNWLTIRSRVQIRCSMIQGIFREGSANASPKRPSLWINAWWRNSTLKLRRPSLMQESRKNNRWGKKGRKLLWEVVEAIWIWMLGARLSRRRRSLLSRLCRISARWATCWARLRTR